MTAHSRTSQKSSYPERYDFFLNPYEDLGCTRCPTCKGKTKIRRFPLFIHVEPHYPISFNKSCWFCPGCELIIMKKRELEAYLAYIMEERGHPECIGNKYFVAGTFDRAIHRKGKKEQLDSREVLDHAVFFKSHRHFELVGGWGKSP